MTDDAKLSVTSAAGSVAGKTVISVSPAITVGNSYKYKVAANPTIPEVGTICSAGYTNWNGSDEITAESGKIIVVVEVDADNAAVSVGTTTVVTA